MLDQEAAVCGAAGPRGVFSPSHLSLRDEGHKRQTYLGDRLSSGAKVELMTVADYNDPLRHTELPSPPVPQPPLSLE